MKHQLTDNLKSVFIAGGCRLDYNYGRLAGKIRGWFLSLVERSSRSSEFNLQVAGWRRFKLIKLVL